MKSFLAYIGEEADGSGLSRSVLPIQSLGRSDSLGCCPRSNLTCYLKRAFMIMRVRFITL